MYQTDWIPYPHYGYVAYRISTRETDWGPVQRHEWKREDGEVEVQAWIKSHIPAASLKNAREVEDAEQSIPAKMAERAMQRREREQRR